MKRYSKSSFAIIAAIASWMVFLPVSAGAADGWGRLNPFNTLPTPKWPEWATIKMPEVDLVPDWVNVPDVPDVLDIRELPRDIARIHSRNMHALGKAVDYINPFKSKTVRLPAPPPPTGSRKTRTTSNSTNSRFWFPSFMQEQRKPIGPSRSVSEFLDRPRIQ